MNPARREPLVLVADDDRDTRELYRACFDTSGYRTAEAVTGSQAIVAAVEIVPDVLLIDYALPDFDGVTVARRLKDDPRTAAIRILMITGYGTAEVERSATAAGVDRVLAKPCLPQAMLREVARALARTAAQRMLAIRPPAKRAATPAIAMRLREEFAALPGLALTAEQARLVFDLDRDMCDDVLRALVAEGFLRRTAHGSFTRPR